MRISFLGWFFFFSIYVHSFRLLTVVHKIKVLFMTVFLLIINLILQKNNDTIVVINSVWLIFVLLNYFLKFITIHIPKTSQKDTCIHTCFFLCSFLYFRCLLSCCLLLFFYLKLRILLSYPIRIFLLISYFVNILTIVVFTFDRHRFSSIMKNITKWRFFLTLSIV